jgi:hypothetical protein
LVAVYLHDVARTHENLCYLHGGDAMAKCETRLLFARTGVVDSDYSHIRSAMVHHSPPKTH